MIRSGIYGDEDFAAISRLINRLKQKPQIFAEEKGQLPTKVKSGVDNIDDRKNVSKDTVSQKALIAIKLQQAKDLQKRMLEIQKKVRSIDISGYQGEFVNILLGSDPIENRKAEKMYQMVTPTPPSPR